MSKNYAIKAEKREQAGKGVARSLRRENKTPAVIYGDKKEPIKIALPANDINVEYNRGHMFTTICELDVAGETHKVLARDVQLHPVTDLVLHVDFLRVTAKTMIQVAVPVNVINEEQSPGLKDNGVLNMVRFDLELLCSAMNIPDAIDVDLTGVEQGQSVHIEDVKLPEGVKSALDWNFTILNVAEPRRIEVIPDEAPEGLEGEDDAEGEGAENAKEGSADAEVADEKGDE